MQISRMVTLALACVGFAQTQPALAQTLRCGSVLIQPGDDARYVLEKCGEPGSTISGAEPAERTVNGNVHWNVGAGRWRYHRGVGQFSVVLVIGDSGRVEAIEFDHVRD